MTCYYPVSMYQNKNGGPLSSRQRKADDKEVTISCGQCIGCRIKKMKDWSIRIMHESQPPDRDWETG